MRAMVPLWMVALCALPALPAPAQAPDLPGLVAAQTKLVYVSLVSAGTSDRPGLGDLLAPNGWPAEFQLKDGTLPANLAASMQGLAADQTLLLYVFSPDGGPTQDDFPLADLAAIINKVQCRHVITIIDLPTVPRRLAEITPQVMLDAQRRHEMFGKGMTIFTCGAFGTRLMGADGQSTFLHWLTVGLEKRFADANSDGRISLWEAYEYAFWCTLADSVQRTHRVQTACYSLTEGWTAQPFLLTDLQQSFPPEPDPQALLFAQASLRLPVDVARLDPPGAMGPAGPSWLSWTCGPLPDNLDTAGVSAWAEHDLRVLRQNVAQLEAQSAALAAVERAPEQPSMASTSKLLLWLPLEFPPGPPGPLAAPRAEVRAARGEAIALIGDAENRERARENSDLLEQVGLLAQGLSGKLQGLTQSAAFALTWRMARVDTRPGICLRPRQWPAQLGVLAPVGPSGPAGPPGAVQPGTQFHLDSTAGEPLWSPKLADELHALQRRLEAVQARLEY